VGAETRHLGVGVGVRQSQLDAAIELGEASLTGDLQLARAQQTADERVVVGNAARSFRRAS
jgi:hypothetical protein